MTWYLTSELEESRGNVDIGRWIRIPYLLSVDIVRGSVRTSCSYHDRIFPARQRCLGFSYAKPNLGFDMVLRQCIPQSCKPLRTK